MAIYFSNNSPYLCYHSGMWNRLIQSIKALEDTSQSLLSVAGAFLGIIVLRLTIEGALTSFPQASFSYTFFQFTHTFLFFLFSFIVFIFIFQYLSRESLLRTVNVLLFGFLIILTPPIIDTIIFGNQVFWSFYEFDGLRGLVYRYFTLFGDTPQVGITYGVRIEVVLMTLASTGYIYLKTHSKFRTLLAFFLTYTTFFILGTFPSWLTLMLDFPSQSLLEISAINTARIFLTPENILSQSITDIRSVLSVKISLVYSFLVFGGLLLLLAKTKWSDLKALFQNARFPQIFFHSGLLILGSLLAWHFEKIYLPFTLFSTLAYLLLLISVAFAWITSVIVNDFYDVKIDRVTNQSRPLIKDSISKDAYLGYAAIFFFFSLLFAGIVSHQALLLLFCYQVTATLYSAPPLRLKRFPILATLLAAFANIIILSIGYLVISDQGSIQALPTSILLYLLFALAFCLALKDFKDIAGDAEDGVFTIPVLLGEERAKLFIGSGLFFVFSLVPLLLKQTSLLPLSLFFATVAFFMVQKGTNDEKSFFYYKRFSLLFFSLTFFYGLLLTLSLALNV
jgi:4-hydroxybenzoate polyprenyltransferase